MDECRRKLKRAFLEFFHHEIRNHFKVPRIASHDGAAEMQCSGSDQQILKRNLDAFTLLIAVDSSCQERDLFGKRIGWNIS